MVFLSTHTLRGIKGDQCEIGPMGPMGPVGNITYVSGGTGGQLYKGEMA
jgi:hypothetical protein